MSEAPGYGDIPISPRSEGAEVVPIQPSFHEREGNRADAPQVSLPAAIAAHEQLLEDRREVRETPIPNLFDKDNRQVSIPVPVTWTEEEYRARAERFDRFRAQIAQIGNRVLSDGNGRLAKQADDLATQLEEIDSSLADLLPDSQSDLGDIGEYSAEDYGALVNPLWAQREAVVAQIRVLEQEAEVHAQRRAGGGYINGLNTICSYPAEERRFVEMLHGAAIEDLNLPAAKFRNIDLDKLASLRSRTVRSLNRAEDVYRALEDRDERRARRSARELDDMARTAYPALRSHLRSTS